jgi:AcrR family transcriptional regulator
MDEIAQNAELAKGTLYLYFKSKEELLYRILEPFLEELRTVWPN